MLLEQEKIANDTRSFLTRWGLKAKYVANKCNINPKIFSQFTNHRLTLSNNQLQRLVSFITEYEKRNNEI